MRPPEIETIKNVKEILPEYYTSKTGIPVVIVQAGTEPITRIDFIFQAGSRYQDQIFQSSFTNQMLKEGTTKHTAHQIAEHFDFYGSYFHCGVDRDEAEIVLYSINKHLDPTLSRFIEILSHPTFPEEELNILKNNQIQTLSVENEKVETLARNRFLQNIYGTDHPYGVSGEPEHISLLNRGILKSFFSKFYSKKHLQILVTTSQPMEVVNLLETKLGYLSLQGSTNEDDTLKRLPGISTTQESRTLITKKNAVQAAVQIGKSLFPRSSNDFHGLSILVSILGGYFGSRLMQNIREEKGYTYGIGSSFVTLRDHGHLSINTTVGADKWEATLSECRYELHKLCSEHVLPEELDRVRRYLIGDLLRKLDGPYQLADLFRTLLLHNLDFSHVTNYLNWVHSITSEELRDLATKHLDPDTMVEVVCRPE